MFSYCLPNGGLRSHGFYDDSGAIKFDPPVYEQRYTSVCRILDDRRWKIPVKKVVEYGCAEMRLLPLMRRVESIEHILQIDINGELLENNKERAQPLVSDYLSIRSAPLQIDIFKGSITSAVEQVRDVDAVVGVEIIEHLDKEVLDLVPANIFGFIKPKLCILSTPNADVNVLFNGLLPNGFRHDDHRFEWTRLEFQTWCLTICEQYPNYKVAIIGVGNVPPLHEALGCVSQMAIFARNDLVDLPLATEIIEISCTTDPNAQIEPFELIQSVKFPHNRDERTVEQKIVAEVKYYIMNTCHHGYHLNEDRDTHRIPLNPMIDYAATLNVTESDLRALLQENNIVVEGVFIVVPYAGYGYRSDSPNDEDLEEDNRSPVVWETLTGCTENWD